MSPLIFAAASVASILYVLWVGRGETLILDEWSYLTGSSGWSAEALLAPHNGHLIVFPLLVLKLMYATVGISSHFPYQILSVLLNVTIASLVYVFFRQRVGPWFALAPGVLILFYGAGWDAFVTTYELPDLIGLAAGLGALLAVERGDLRGDAMAAVLLAVSLASFTVGVAFGAGILVALSLRGRHAMLRRSWVVLAPGVLYVAWFLWARKFHQTEITAYNFGAIFSGIMDQLSAVLSGIAGLFTTPAATELGTMISVRSDWGPALVVGLAILVVLAVRRRPPAPALWIVLTILIAYFAMVALNFGLGRTPAQGRYVYLGSILTLLVLAEIARGVVVTRVWAFVLSVGLGLSLLANGATIAAGGRLVRLESATNRAELAALEIARDRVPANLQVETPGQTTLSNPDMFFDAQTYFGFSDAYGSPAYSEAEVDNSPEQARDAADQFLGRALPISTTAGFHPGPRSNESVELVQPPVGGSAEIKRRCLLVAPSHGRRVDLVAAVPAGGLTYRVAQGVRLELSLRRFGEAFSVTLPVATESARLTIPRDRSERRWQVRIASSSRLQICP